MLEEELLAILTAVSAPSASTSTSSNSMNPTPLMKNMPNVKHIATTTSHTTELESVVSHEDVDRDRWMEVGKRNHTVVMHTVYAVCVFLVVFMSHFWHFLI